MEANGPEMLALAVLAGAGATLATDLWALLLRALGVAPLDWALVGRWIGHWFRGRFVHERIAMATPVTGERALGWSFHYGVGMVFALMLLAAMGPQWAARPSLMPCLIMGWATAVFPFFVMQPALGAGIAASRTPQPWNARMKSLLTHTVFGLGLYVALRAIAALAPAG
jgi:hypothetical protein